MISTNFLVLSALLWTSHVYATCAHGTHLVPRQKEGEGVKIAEFGYTGKQGPLQWHLLSAENAKVCDSM